MMCACETNEKGKLIGTCGLHAEHTRREIAHALRTAAIYARAKYSSREMITVVEHFEDIAESHYPKWREDFGIHKCVAGIGNKDQNTCL
ncbi:hypothetical protein LCGC14_1069300 [marine sediment metagenome]|uniref:Uncharacterized protein n=1 Tax=marine sediment metagenome TaxID=412755 RepID=A0A0F9QPI8_9ZZZZ